MTRLEARLEAFAEETGERVAIIGQSRGGVFARALARPPAGPRVRHRHARLARPSRSSARTRSCSPRSLVVGALGHRPGARDVPRCAACAARAASVSAPTWQTLSRARSASPRCTRSTDGVVDWRACLDPAAEQVEVRASHLGMGLNAEVYAEVGHALGRFVRDDGQYWAQAA